nr:putative isomerase [Quercus suber]
MAKLPVKYYVVDAFTDTAFKGNPAAVCLLEEERDEKWLQAVAAEFNIAETGYLTRQSGSDSLDSSNPRLSFVAMLHWQLHMHCFHLNGESQDCFLIELDFPTIPTIDFNSEEVSSISNALNGASVIDIKKTATSDALLVVLPSGESVVEIQPEFDAIRKCPGSGIIATGAAPSGSGFDFYSRAFWPKLGINEDPVTGSAHCALAPYWSKKLGKCDLVAYQASPRSGVLNIHLDEQNQRVLMRGKSVTIIEGSLLV